jgi:hypothetical protein
MSKPEIVVGTFWVWLFFRVMTIPLSAMAIGLGFWNLSASDRFGPLLAVFLVAVMVIGQDDLIYGRANEEGISYRRYSKEKFVPWSEISTVSWTLTQDLQICLKRDGWFRQTLFAKSQDSMRLWPKVAAEDPEFIRWLAVVKPPTAGGIELRPPQPLTWFQNLNPLGAMRFTLAAILCLGTLVLYLIFRVR